MKKQEHYIKQNGSQPSQNGADGAGFEARADIVTDDINTGSPSTKEHAVDYVKAGFALVLIPAGKKGPVKRGWNRKKNCITTPKQAEIFGRNNYNIGLAHAYSGTCAIDIDDYRGAVEWLSESSVDLQALFAADDAVQIKSGRENRGKLLYRLPEPLRTVQITGDGGKMLLEFRCANSSGTTVQDVLPPSIHPDTGKPYTLRGDIRRIPEIPKQLLDLWKARLADDGRARVDKHTAPTIHVDQSTIEELRSALEFMPSDDYELWIAVGHALHELGDKGFELWDTWSRKSEKYKEDETTKKWSGFRPNNTGYQAVFAKAQDAGWQNPLKKAARHRAENESDVGPVEDEDLPKKPDKISTDDAERLVAYVLKTGAQIPKDCEDCIPRIKIAGRDTYSAPWASLALDAGSWDKFMPAVNKYLPRREDMVRREAEKKRTNPEDLPAQVLEADAVQWMNRVKPMAVPDEEGRALLSKAYPWPDPEPLAAPEPMRPYPIDYLPLLVRDAVIEAQQAIQAPIPLLAASALTAVSTAAQGLANVRRGPKLDGPVGLYMLTLADSGERKSTGDDWFMCCVRDHDTESEWALKSDVEDHKAALRAWDAEVVGVERAIIQASKFGKPTDVLREKLESLQRRKPVPPLVPAHNAEDASPEALAYRLATGWPSAGLVSAEGGAVLGSHAMGKDSVLRSLALFNKLWSGESIRIDRRTKESFTLRGARLTLGLAAQPEALREFLDKNGTLARGTGFLARFLVSWPASTQGTRLYRDPPEGAPALDRFSQAIRELLDMPLPMDEKGCLTPSVLDMSPDAKTVWIDFHNEVERSLGTSGDFFDLRDVASKTADNAARLAALFHILEHGPEGQIGMTAIEQGTALAAWYLYEARRFMGEIATPPEINNAQKLDGWLLAKCREGGSVTVREAMQFGPNPARRRKALDTVLEVLMESGRARLIDERPARIEVNPALLDGEEVPQ